MNEQLAIYASYARQPSAEGETDLQAKLFMPDGAEGAVPLLVWLHAGGFRTGDIEAAGHNRIARIMGRQGYACAFVQYRLRGRTEDLSAASQALLPDLIADAEAHFPDINPAFTGARALAAVEDAAAFFGWVQNNAAAHGLSGRYLLGGGSAGAMTVLNLLSLAPHLGIALPEIPTAIVLSGAFAYPSFFTPSSTRILAIHGTNEAQIPPASMRAYAYRNHNTCTLLEDIGHQHGDPRITRHETLRKAVRRFVQFDRGARIASARTDLPERAIKRKNRICLFTCVKNEGPFLLEWIAHNRAIGVTDFVIFSNDCDDGTTEMLDRLEAMGIVQHVPNPSTSLGSDQHLGLAIHCAPYTKAFRRADYVILTDVDEFIQINTADGTLNGLLAVTGYPDVISMSELLYGFDGIETFHDRLVTEQFRASVSPTPEAKGTQRGVKSVMRASRDVASYSNHRPTLKPEAVAGIDWLDGAGQPVSAEFITRGKRGLDAGGRYRLAWVNHYTLRSGESMLVKFQRGDAVRPGRMRRRYFRDRNGRDIRNDGAGALLEPLRAELAILMQDADLARLHAESVARHKDRIAALKADPAFAEIWRAIRNEAALPILSDPHRSAAE
jgi:glycosyl transferase family 2